MKICTKCGETKPLDDFHRCKSYKDGRRSQCKECRKVPPADNKVTKRLKQERAEQRIREFQERDRAEIEKVRCLHGKCMRPGTDLPQGLGFRFCDIHAPEARTILNSPSPNERYP